MPSKDFRRKSDAELARFCVDKSAELARLQYQIRIARVPDSRLDDAYNRTAVTLNNAITELQARTDQASRTTT